MAKKRKGGGGVLGCHVSIPAGWVPPREKTLDDEIIEILDTTRHEEKSATLVNASAIVGQWRGKRFNASR